MADRASVDSNESVTTSDEYEIIPSNVNSFLRTYTFLINSYYVLFYVHVRAIIFRNAIVDPS